MKFAILNDNDLIVENVLTGNSIEDIERIAKFKAYPEITDIELIDAEPMPDGVVVVEKTREINAGISYTITDGVRDFTQPLFKPSEEEQLAELYKNVTEYQLAHVDDNTKAEIDKAESLYENGKATPADLPLADKTAIWVENALYGSPVDEASADGTYFARKNNIIAGNDGTSFDFSNIVPDVAGFVEIRTERKTFLAGQ